ncbi:hypothetical protein PQX77_014673 [Marasmius sp. AFHP31]|nr:hypothetical protein PQX77_014673 [Marasmius sp. AFHP31]
MTRPRRSVNDIDLPCVRGLRGRGGRGVTAPDGIASLKYSCIVKGLDEADVQDDEVEALVKEESEMLESVEEVEADDGAKYDESSGVDGDIFL